MPLVRATITAGTGAGSKSITVHDEAGEHRLRGVRTARIDLGRPDQIPTLALELNLRDAVIDGQFTVELDPATRAALIAAGWTPPAESL